MTVFYKFAKSSHEMKEFGGRGRSSYDGEDTNHDDAY